MPLCLFIYFRLEWKFYINLILSPASWSFWLPPDNSIEVSIPGGSVLRRTVFFTWKMILMEYENQLNLTSFISSSFFSNVLLLEVATLLELNLAALRVIARFLLYIPTRA